MVINKENYWGYNMSEQFEFNSSYTAGPWQQVLPGTPDTIKVSLEMKLVLDKLDYIVYVLQELLAEEEAMDEEIQTVIEEVVDGQPKY